MLKLNYLDDTLNESINTERQYEIIRGADGKSQIKDVTSYSQVGDDIGAAQFKEISRSLYGFINTELKLKADGSIESKMDIGTKVTKINADGSITQRLVDNDGNTITKVTKVNADGSVTSSVTNVVAS